MKDSYEFDPTELDDEIEDEEEEVSIDDWKPTEKKKAVVQSEWRKRQIGDNFNQMPGMEDLRKIESLIEKNVSDAEIMQVFGIRAEVMTAIRRNRYSPIDGVEIDILSKLYREFDRIEEKIDKALRGVTYMSECIFTDKEGKENYAKALKKKKKASGIGSGNNNRKKKKVEEDDVEDDVEAELVEE